MASSNQYLVITQTLNCRSFTSICFHKFTTFKPENLKRSWRQIFQSKICAWPWQHQVITNCSHLSLVHTSDGSGDGRVLTFWCEPWKRRREHKRKLDGSGDGRKGSVPFSSVASSTSVVLPSQTSKCEPILTEAQAETEGWANENAIFQSLSRNSCKHGEIYYLLI